LSGSWLFHNLPLSVLLAQRAWEKRHRIRIACVHGKATHVSIGRVFGVTGHRIGQLVAKAERDIRQNRLCPAERYINTAAAGAIRALAKMK
jgi:hypothetical protein